MAGEGDPVGAEGTDARQPRGGHRTCAAPYGARFRDLGQAGEQPVRRVPRLPCLVLVRDSEGAAAERHASGLPHGARDGVDDDVVLDRHQGVVADRVGAGRHHAEPPAGLDVQAGTGQPPDGPALGPGGDDEGGRGDLLAARRAQGTDVPAVADDLDDAGIEEPCGRAASRRAADQVGVDRLVMDVVHSAMDAGPRVGSEGAHG